ncbi:MAG: phosphopantetheine-binding protein, partial [Chloroflexi bacterium]|nr:phosphopantetheine-binding protein [Chloroflexota bacterium]
VDRHALPAPAPTRPDLETPFTAPRTPAEDALAAIWADVLGIERVGVDDDFFALGGHSLLATRMVAHARDALGVDLPLRRVFETPTVAALAVVVAKAAADTPRAESIRPVATVSSGAATRLLTQLDTLSEAEVDGLLDQLHDEDNAVLNQS